MTNKPHRAPVAAPRPAVTTKTEIPATPPAPAKKPADQPKKEG